MSASLDILARCFRDICHGLFSGGDGLPKPPAHTKPRYVRARNGGREGVYQVLDKRKDYHSRTVKQYRRVRDGPGLHLEGTPDEWIASRAHGPRSGTPYKKPRHANADTTHSRIPVRINRRESARSQGVDIVGTSQTDTHANNSRRQKVTRDHRGEHSTHHRTHIQFSQRSARREQQSITHQRTVMIVEDQEESEVESQSYPDNTTYQPDINSTPPTSDSPIPITRLTSPFQQPRMTAGQSQAMVFGRNDQTSTELSESRTAHAVEREHVIGPDDGRRGRQR